MSDKERMIEASRKEGFDAFWDGLHVRENPYDSDTQSEHHKAWTIGWNSARLDSEE